MPANYDALTEKEKATLRLIVRGHDAKSIARHLSLSVHTVNERLRDARRKLAVSSSREAARLLLEREGDTPDLIGTRQIGGATAPDVGEQQVSPISGGGRATRPALLIAGAALMSLVLGLLAFVAMPQTAPAPVPATTATGDATDAQVVAAARQWLALLDQGRWDESWAATARSFRTLNTAQVWATASLKVRAPLGAMVSRTLLSQEDLPAPPHGYEVVKFRTRFANADAVETVSLDREDGVWRVVGVTIGQVG